MMIGDLAALLRERIERAGTRRDLAKIERTMAAVHVGETFTTLLSFVGPDIKRRRAELARLENAQTAIRSPNP